MAKLKTLVKNNIEIDGEASIQENFRYRSAFSDDIKSNQNLKGDYDSGHFTMSMSTSLESGFSKQDDKVPVQCSEDIAQLETKLCNLNIQNIQEGDEGILSFESLQSLQSVGSDSSEPVEVDLFEQDVDGDTLLHLAILGDAPLLAYALIDMVEDVECLNLQNHLFQTPLHMAIITEHYDIAVLLVKKGADVRRSDKQGNTPLHLACRKGEKDVVKAILDTFRTNKRARQQLFTMKNFEGLTCLHLATEQKHFLIMGYLFAKGADVNMGDAKSGRTILHYAVEKRDLETVALLLTHPEVNPDCKTFKGETPLVLAYWRNHQDIIRELKSNGSYFSYDMFKDSEDDAS